MFGVLVHRSLVHLGVLRRSKIGDTYLAKFVSFNLKSAFVVMMSPIRMPWSHNLVQISRNHSTIVVVGSGAVGLQYGSRILEKQLLNNNAPISIHFLMRTYYDHVVKQGWALTSADGYFSTQDSFSRVQNHIHKNTSSLPRNVDWIVCALKSHALLSKSTDGNGILETLHHISGPETRILAIMNGLDCEEVLVKNFGSHRVFGGMAFTCVNRSDRIQQNTPLHVNHIAYGDLLIGHCADDPKLLSEVKSLWHGTKIQDRVLTTDSLLKARWSKLFWNVPFSGVSIVTGGGVSVDVIARDPDLRNYADLVMRDVISLANEELHAVQYPGDLFNVDEVRERMWRLTDNAGPYKTSILLDLVNSRDLEVEYIFSRVLDRSRRYSAGGPNKWPYLESLCLQVLLLLLIAAVISYLRLMMNFLTLYE